MDRSLALLEAFARESGRSVHVQVGSTNVEWVGGVDDDVTRPAASLLKLPLAMALEPLLPDLAPVAVGELLAFQDISSVLYALDPERSLTPAEALRLMLSASDNPCAQWGLDIVGPDAVRATTYGIGATRTTIEDDLTGATTARDAVVLLRTALNPERFPVSARALRHSTRNSRIPLGATDQDVRIAHKTGTLTGIASDVAHLECVTGDMWLAFLTEDQHDTLVTGYEMGICARHLLEHFGLQVTRTISAQAGG